MSSDGSRKGEITVGACSLREDQAPPWSGAFPVAGLERRSVPPKHFCGIERGDDFVGWDSLSAYSFPSPSPPFRCIPSTDGGSEARCQQGSEQPFPGAPTSLAPPHYSSLPVPGSLGTTGRDQMTMEWVLLFLQLARIPRLPDGECEHRGWNMGRALPSTDPGVRV